MLVTKEGQFFFACIVVNVWNSLPDTVGFTSLAVFKRCIKTVDFSEFLMHVLLCDVLLCFIVIMCK